MKVGDKIQFTNLHEGSVLQVKMFYHAEKKRKIRTETYWKNAKFSITLSNNNEIESLSEILQGGDEYELETDDYIISKAIDLQERQSFTSDDINFNNHEEIYKSEFKCNEEYFIIFNGIKIIEDSNQGQRGFMDIDLSCIIKTTSQAEAIKEFYEPAGLADFYSESFHRSGYWAVAVTFGEGDSAIYLGAKIEEIPKTLLSFGEYGINFDPMREKPGTNKFKSIEMKDRLILCSHPESNPKENFDVFIKIK